MSRHPVEGVNQHPPYDISAIIPPGISMSNHMMTARLHKGPSALTYIWFYNQVRNHGPWDYKQLGGKYENFGNFHYGAFCFCPAKPRSRTSSPICFLRKKLMIFLP